MDKAMRDHIRAERDRLTRARVRYLGTACKHTQSLDGTERFAELPTNYRLPFRVTSGDTMLGSREGL